MDYETICEIYHFTICHFSLSPFLAKLLTEKLSFTIGIRSFKRKKKIINYHVKFEYVQLHDS